MSASQVLAIDVGGMRMKVAGVAREDSILDMRYEATPGPDACLDRV